MKEVFINSTSQTFVEIASWITISLLVFEIFNFLFRNRFSNFLLNSKKIQPLIGAIMGIIPGCGATLFLIPLYNKRKITIGTLTASFVSTFGDAAFLILSINPIVFLWISFFSLILGIITGYIIDLTPMGRKWESYISKNSKELNFEEMQEATIEKKEKENLPKFLYFLDRWFMPFVIFSLILSVFPMAIIKISVPPDTWGIGIQRYDGFSKSIGFVGVFMSLSYYFSRKLFMYKYVHFDDRNHFHKINEKMNIHHLVHDVFVNILFMISWIFVGAFIFEIFNYYFASELEEFFSIGSGMLAVVIGVFVGVIPGCGPQIVFANLFGGGAVQFPALVANSISQDGDGGFPLIAKDWKSFLVVKIYNILVGIFIGGLLVLLAKFNLIVPF